MTSCTRPGRTSASGRAWCSGCRATARLERTQRAGVTGWEPGTVTHDKRLLQTGYFIQAIIQASGCSHPLLTSASILAPVFGSTLAENLQAWEKRRLALDLSSVTHSTGQGASSPPPPPAAPLCSALGACLWLPLSSAPPLWGWGSPASLLYESRIPRTTTDRQLAPLARCCCGLCRAAAPRSPALHAYALRPRHLSGAAQALQCLHQRASA